VNTKTIPSLNLLQSLVRQAGEFLRADFRRDYRVFHKGEIDLVTDVDLRTEAFLINEVKRLFPDHSIISEERGSLPARNDAVVRGSGNMNVSSSQESKHLDKQWYIDPLDGTVNFAHGVPVFSVSVAFAEDGDLRLAVVYDPLREECFSAERGFGAWLNGIPIQPSTTRELIESLLVTGFPYDIRENPENNLNHYARFALRTQGVRRLGSAALDLCYVACGRLDGFWELSLGPWDMAAGVLIAQEAGAIVTSVNGDTNLFAPPYSILAANPILHPQMYQVIKEAI
jgi:myo-inositol-1(or 4)-monophosphatase